MADPNDNENGNDLKAVEASAGDAERIEAMEEGLAFDVPAPSADELDARQAAIGETRRSGPPLPEGEDMGEIAMDESAGEDEPTTVAEPRRQDR